MIVFHHWSITCVGCKKTDCVVSPVIIQTFSVHHTGIFHLIKLKNRHQLHCIDPEILQIRDLFPQALKSTWCFHAGGCISCETTHMHFINDQIFKRMIQKTALFPIKIIFHYPGMVYKVFSTFRALSPVSLPCHCPGVWIKQDIVFMKPQSFFFIIWSIQLERIFKLFDI